VLLPGENLRGLRGLDALRCVARRLIEQAARERVGRRRERAPLKKESAMDTFSFGPRDGGIIQIAYSVPDIEEGMRHYSELLHVGPWFLIGPFVPPKGVYRGAPTKARFSLALAYSGQLMVELIQQHGDEPSVFQETLKARGAHGFHHWAVGARDFEKTAAHYRSLGYQEAFSDTAPEPLGCRVIYFDTGRELPGMLEVIEINAAAEEAFHKIYQAAQEWNGKDHIVHRS
jgi:Glyoxalase/Bleomycin resistance protein/Dioxygenase superfamily